MNAGDSAEDFYALSYFNLSVMNKHNTVISVQQSLNVNNLNQLFQLAVKNSIVIQALV